MILSSVIAQNRTRFLLIFNNRRKQSIEFPTAYFEHYYPTRRHEINHFIRRNKTESIELRLSHFVQNLEKAQKQELPQIQQEQYRMQEETDIVHKKQQE